MAPRLIALLFVLLLAAPEPSAQTIHFVDDDATGVADGTSWTDAFVDLQDALAVATASDQIWIAAGTYRPAPAGGNPTVSFTVPAGVEVYGGFDGTEALLSQRAGLFDATILSGDLDGDDGPGFTNTSDNSANVVVLGDGQPGALVLDGVTVRDGNAYNGSLLGGAGLRFAPQGSKTIRNCRILDCEAIHAAGVDGSNAGPLLFEDCRFEGNEARGDASQLIDPQGGAYLGDGATIFRRCAFVGNRAAPPPVLFLAANGGAVVVLGADHLFEECLFEANEAVAESSAQGGALVTYRATTLRRCVFVGNRADGVVSGGAQAGAVSHVASGQMLLTVSQCVFSGNVATGGFGLGGALLSVAGALDVFDSTFTGNAASQGGGLLVDAAQGVVRISNSILYGNTGNGTPQQAQLWNIAGTPTVTSSCIEGLAAPFLGSGNFDADPLFVDADGPDDVLGTADDDLRLGAGSPCIDAGDVAGLPADAGDVDCDGDVAEDVPLDLDGHVRRVDDPLTADTGSGGVPVVDVGPYEYGADLPTDAWADLRNALAGTGGPPLLVGQGTLCAGTLWRIALSGALPGASAWLFLGFAPLYAPFKGGVAVPDTTPPGLILGPIVTDVTGAILLEAAWPAGVPGGISFYWQYWIMDAGGPVGFAASNGIVGVTP